MSRLSHDYSDILTFLNISSVSSAMLGADYIFLHKLLNGVIDCRDILNSYQRKQPVKDLRNTEIFHVPLLNTNILLHSFVIRSSVLANEMRFEFNLFGSSLYNVKNFTKSKYVYE